MKKYSFRNSLLVYVAYFLALTFPYWMHGEVAAPYRQSAEIAAPEINDAEHIENKKFSDYANGYIPELSVQMNGPRSGWLAVWTNQNELGRPLQQISGFSRAYFPSWLIAGITDNPQRFITLLSLGTCFLAGLFILMLCRELRLSPIAGLLAAGCLVGSPLFMYWLVFPMFLAVFCWSAGALYALTRLERRPDLLGGSVLTFSIYSLLMTGYPQLVIFHAYILTVYVAYLAFRHWRSTGWPPTARYLAVITSAVATGGLLAMPMLADLAYAASESARVAPETSFFTDILPKLDSPIAALRILALSLSPEIFGNPISPSHPFPYDGLSATPLVIFLTLLGLLLCLPKTWGWWLAIVVFCALAFIHPLYVFGVEHLGFNLSRNNPIYSTALPLTIIAAYGGDTLVKRLQVYQYSRPVLLSASGTIIGMLIAVGFALEQDLLIRWSVVVMTLVVSGLLAAQFDRNRPILLVTALFMVGTYISFPLMLRQEPSAIVTTSPLVKKVRDNLPPGARYAIAYPGLIELPSNLNATLSLPSIHSYNSLSSKRYHSLIGALGGEVTTYGRWNGSISPDYSGTTFWMSNIALVLSPAKLEHKNLDYLEQVGNVYLYRVASKMGCCLQVTFSPDNITTDGVQIDDPRNLSMHPSSKILDQGDLLDFNVQGSNQASLLILSQKFHRDWHAQALTTSGWSDVKTVSVNGVFQGVLLPEHTHKVHMRFRPYVRFAWIAHVFWLFMLSLLVLRSPYVSRKLLK